MTQALVFTLSRLPTPLGTMLVATDAQARLRVLDWDTHTERMQRLLDRQYGKGAVRLQDGPAPEPLAGKLQAYFAGDLAAIDDIAVETGGTAFQRAVWAALRAIPAGQTWTYGRLAAHIGRPAAVRAVGLANGANPIGVVVPCHRVIGANGGLTGYGGGMDRKAWLLQHEAAPAAARAA
ncbi:MAG: methylated-DNA--protein-cysteine methyltransferase [Caulobacterales bacterium 32-69-10]|nr:MAG: methylated-DNA--protein-cysteine methyltransferase [Caulobacterales bacterium 32-69-10]